MISKRVFIGSANDNYARLAAYIADAGPRSEHGGEKCLMSWCEGMLGGEDYAEGVAEAVDVQARNTRAASKTYHLVISFRASDEGNILSFILMLNLYKLKALTVIAVQARPRKSLDNSYKWGSF